VHTNNQSGSFSLREKDRMRAVLSEPSALTPALSRRERENTDLD
jgi:hypothetical protein